MKAWYLKAKAAEKLNGRFCYSWGCRATVSALFCSLLLTGLYLAVAYFIHTLSTFEDLRLEVLDQVGREWQTQPYVNIEVSLNECEDPFFYRTWSGTQEGCVSGSTVTTEVTAGCETVPALEPVKQSKILGKYICGVRGGKPFFEVTRPDFETKKCPSGTLPCSDKTSPENTICYPEADLETSCPILGVDF